MSQFKRIPLSQFNVTFKRLLDQAQILEGTSRPKDALPKYFELVELIVGFVKTPECPAHLRSKLIATSKSLLEKIKSIQKESTAPINVPVQNSTATNLPSISTEIDENAFAALPNIPNHSPDEDLADSHNIEPPPDVNPINPLIPSTRPDSTPPSDSSTSIIPPSLSGKKAGVMDDFLSKIKNFEEELRKMPPGVTEVKPADFNPYNILNPKDKDTPGINLDDFKKDTIELDKTVADVNSGSKNQSVPPNMVKRNIPDPGFKIKGFKQDPFKADSESNSSPSGTPQDPFTNPDPTEIGSHKNGSRLCFACGANLPFDSQVCPNCGAMNE